MARKTSAPRSKAAKPKSPERSRYTIRLGKEICEKIANGATWLSLCNTGEMPSYSTLYRWRQRYPALAQALAAAKDVAADHRAEKALDVADATTAGTVSADRLRVATLMRHAALTAPKRWGAAAEKPDAGAKSGAAGEAGVRRIIIEVRDFIPGRREDGSLFTREILPDGSIVDVDR